MTCSKLQLASQLKESRFAVISVPDTLLAGAFAPDPGILFKLKPTYGLQTAFLCPILGSLLSPVGSGGGLSIVSEMVNITNLGHCSTAQTK